MGRIDVLKRTNIKIGYVLLESFKFGHSQLATSRAVFEKA